MAETCASHQNIVALKPLTIDIPAGTFLTVLDPSGSGKPRCCGSSVDLRNQLPAALFWGVRTSPGFRFFAGKMQEFLKAQQRRSGTTFLFVTHGQQEAIGISDLILVMRGDGVEQVASPRDLYYRPKTHFVASFFGENNLIEGTTTAHQGQEVRIETKLGSFVAAIPNGCVVGQAANMAIHPKSFALLNKSKT